MKAKKMIDKMGGVQECALILNGGKDKSVPYSRQRVFNWYKSDKIPAWAEFKFAHVWAVWGSK